MQADFDIVTLPGSCLSETLLADAETIRTVTEVIPPQNYRTALLSLGPSS
jgi:hypothetical protein